MEQQFREADWPRPTGRVAKYRDTASGQEHLFDVSANSVRSYIGGIDGFVPALTRVTIRGVSLEFLGVFNESELVEEDAAVLVPKPPLPTTLQELRRAQSEEFLRDQQARHAGRRQICVESRPSERQAALNDIAARQRQQISDAYQARRDNNKYTFQIQGEPK